MTHGPFQEALKGWAVTGPLRQQSSCRRTQQVLAFDILDIETDFSFSRQRKSLLLYLLFPFASSVLFTFGALFLKRATAAGISAPTQIFLANIIASIFFSFFLLLGGEFPGFGLIWQPALIGFLYLAGQAMIFMAINVGDVSVAAPVASLKVVVVAVLLTIMASAPPSTAVWIAAFFSAVGVFLINYFVPRADRGNVALTAVLAFCGASTFALFDVCIQMFSVHWSTGLMAPISFWFVALFSLVLLPWVNRWTIIREKGKVAAASLGIGCLLVAIQATFLVYSVATFGNAASINVVYSLRGLWGVVFAWLLADYFGGKEAQTPRKTMVMRLAGASLLVTAVIITILGE